MSNAINVVRATDLLVTFVIRDAFGNPADITGDTITFSVKENKTDADVQAKIHQIIVLEFDGADNSDGKVEFQLSSADTDIQAGGYIYGLQWERIASANSEIVAVLDDVFNVAQDIVHGEQ